jgi:hypothetical protein
VDRAEGQGRQAPIATKTPTVADYLAYWLEEVIKPNREEATYSAYSLSSRLYVIPGIGKKQVHKLTVRQTQEWLNKIPGACQCCAQKKDARRKVPRCCAAGACCGDYPSRRAITGARNTLRAALNNAKREELISRNVADLVTIPKARKKSQRRLLFTTATGLPVDPRDLKRSFDVRCAKAGSRRSPARRRPSRLRLLPPRPAEPGRPAARARTPTRKGSCSRPGPRSPTGC